ncbi:hypothetical protein PTTG_27865 [Puccinia triticina 1-1 BBBD Race 1]|uniref:Uncharacterized protein n=1 Tax=Puccinia triticina (isolate 1-1 / race 1 (BBBD)) TaxID=630390 RepID=A0A180GHN4_PUCT1|nr:hypothetical protein PTTG_27865 [Puccinia triticina 1-1 BBBD Race 1]
MAPSSPALNVVAEDNENEIVTDSDQENDPDLDQTDNDLELPISLGDHPLDAHEEDDDIPLAKLQHSLQRHLNNPTRQPLPRCFVSASNTDRGESAYDGDSDRRSDCTNPSDEDEAHLHHQHPTLSLTGTPQIDRISSQSSSLSSPHTRLGRSHTFGFSRLSSTRKSMSAGEGHPHNWINGFEDEEEDIVSNPSDEEEAELHQLQRTIIQSSLAEITSPINQSAIKSSTPTSRFLLSTAGSPDQATNLAITVGRATGSVMSVGLFESSSSASHSAPKPGSTSGLNAFAAEFKPSFGSSTPMIRNPSFTFSDHPEGSRPKSPVLQVKATQAELPSSLTENVSNPVVIASTAPDGMPSVILFEHPVSSAPFQVSNSLASLPVLKEIHPASTPPYPPTTTHQPSEQPGKDNMRSFKFPATPTPRMVLYQARMSRSTSSSAAVSPILAPAQAVNIKQSSSSLSPGAAPQDPHNGSDPTNTSGFSSQKTYPSLVINLPVSPAPSGSGGSGHSVVLRQRSSFDDDSGSDLSPSATRTMTDENPGSSSFYIPTQPRSKSPSAREEDEEDEDEDEDDDDELERRSHNSLVSLRQLQEQKKQWEKLSSTGVSRVGNSDYDDEDRDSFGSNRDNPSTESIRVLLDVSCARKRESKPPQVNVPPGSPFSPFEGSFEDEPPTLRLPPPSPHAILSPSLPRLLAFKPSKNNLAQNFKTNATSPQKPQNRARQEDELEGVPEISIRNRHLTSPATRWFAGLEDGESSAKVKLEISTAEDDTLCSSKKIDQEDDDDEEEDRDSSSGDSSSNCSFVVESDGRRYRAEAGDGMKSSHANNHHRQLFMSDLERLLTRKLKGLRQDLGELHSLKVDWDSLKRDAILDEINVRMDNILNSWLGGSGKEKIGGSMLSDQKADLMVAAIDRWGSQTEEKLISAIKNLPSPGSSSADPEVTQKIQSALELLNSQLAKPSLGLDLDELTSKLSEAVKPQIGQLIDLASDKSETAELILKQLMPCFTQLNGELASMIKSFSMEMANYQSEKQGADKDSEFWKGLEERLMSTQIESQKNILEQLEKQSTTSSLQEIKRSSDETLETVLGLETKSSKMYEDLSNQIDRVGQELSGDLKIEIEKMLDRRKETDELIDQLRAKNTELETSVIKARAEHGKIRSERAVERERQQEDNVRLAAERDRLKDTADALRLQHESLGREKTEIENQKITLVANLDQSKLLVDQLKASLDSYKTRESQWETEQAEQKEKMRNLEMANRLHESEISTLKREMTMKEKFYESHSESNEREIRNLKEREIEMAAQIKGLIEDKIPLIKNFDQEIRDLVRLKSEADGEIRTLKKRISDQDEQIGNLHQSSASKQQALAMANQKLSELERRGKQESEGVKAELEKMKVELSRVSVESEAKQQTLEEDKRRMEGEMERMRAEAGLVKEEVEAVYQTISVELKDSLQRQAELEAELTASKDVTQLLKNQLADLRAHHLDKQQQARMAGGGQNGLMVFNNSTQPHWQAADNLSQRYRPPTSAEQGQEQQDSAAETIDFVSSTIPLTHSIHAPKPTAASSSSIGHTHPNFFHAPPESRSDSRLSAGTVTSFNHHPNPRHHHHPSSSSYPAPGALASKLVIPNSPFNPLDHQGMEGGSIRDRSVSPTPSRTSVLSRVTVTMDQDGWWSSQDY